LLREQKRIPLKVSLEKELSVKALLLRIDNSGRCDVEMDLLPM
jgi:hypothetical protein